LEALGERALEESAATAKRVGDQVAKVWGKEWVKQWGKPLEAGNGVGRPADAPGFSQGCRGHHRACCPTGLPREVIGDLHERYRSPPQYAMEVLRTAPLVIASRICRTADPQVLSIQALSLYLSF
jgi:hypothetical protein